MRTPAIWRLHIYPAYFVANARPGEISMDTHSCSAEQGNPVEIRNTADQIRGAVNAKPVSFIAKASHWVHT